MPSFRRLEDIPSTFSKTSIPSLVRLHERPTNSACLIGKRILLGLWDGKLVLVDRKGRELASAIHPSIEESKEEVSIHVVASGHRFAASMGRRIVFGEIVDDEIRFTAQTKRFVGSLSGLYVTSDATHGSVVSTSFPDVRRFSWDGTLLDGAAASSLELNLLDAFTKLDKVQEVYAELGAQDTVVRDEVWLVLKSAVASPDEPFVPAEYALFPGRGAKKATAAINAIVKELVTLLRIAAKEDPSIAKSFLQEKRKGKAISIGAPAPRGDRSAPNGRADNEIVVIASTWRNGAPFLLDEEEFSDSALEVGQGLFADESTNSLYVLYEDRLERVDTSTGARETIYRGRIRSCFFNGRKQFVIGTHDPSLKHPRRDVVLFDPVSRKSEVLRNASVNDAGIVEGEAPARIRDLEGRDILLTGYHVEILSIDTATRTVAFIDRMERLDKGDGKTRIARAGDLKPIATVERFASWRVPGDGIALPEHHVRLGREVFFAAPVSYNSGQQEIRMFDFTSAKPRVFEKFVMAGPHPCVDDVLYAQEEVFDGSARLSELSKEGVKTGPELSAPPEREQAMGRIGVGLLVVVHVADDYVVVCNGEQTAAVWVLDRRTLAPIGEPLFHPTHDYMAVAVDDDVVSMLCFDNSIQRYRVKV